MNRTAASPAAILVALALATACTDRPAPLAPLSTPEAAHSLRVPTTASTQGDATGQGFKPDSAPLLPNATFSAPPGATVGQTFTLTLTNAQVPGHPEATRFAYAFDCGDGLGYTRAASAARRSCVAKAAGPHPVKAKVIYQSNATEYRSVVIIVPTALKRQQIRFTTTAPIPANVGAVYVVRATATSGLPVTFSLGGSRRACTVVNSRFGGAVTFAGAGTCTILADQQGDATYAAAPQVKQVITVRRPDGIPCNPQNLNSTSPTTCP